MVGDEGWLRRKENGEHEIASARQVQFFHQDAF